MDLLSRESLESRWQANERELQRLAAMPPLDREFHAKREDELLDEQDAIELRLGLHGSQRRASLVWNLLTEWAKGMAPRIEANPDVIIARYRDVIALSETAKDEPGRAEWQGVAKRMRQAWREWQGADSLHEMAIGEPGD